MSSKKKTSFVSGDYVSFPYHEFLPFCISLPKQPVVFPKWFLLFFILPDHCTSLFQIQLRWIVYRDDHEDNKNSFQSESS